MEFTVLLFQLDRRFPQQFPFCLQPVIKISANASSIGKKKIMCAVHYKVAHFLEFVKNGFSFSNRKCFSHVSYLFSEIFRQQDSRLSYLLHWGYHSRPVL